MNNSINQISNVNFLAVKNLKGKSNVTYSVNQSASQNIAFKGAEALAVYNQYIVDSKKIAEIPVLKPVEIPADFNKIQGEKIYNSDGKLVRVYSIDGDKELAYNFNVSRDKLESVNVRNIVTNESIHVDYDEKGNLNCVTKPISDNLRYTTYYNDDGKPWFADKVYIFDDNDRVRLSRDVDEKTLSVNYSNDSEYRSAYFDKNMKLNRLYEEEEYGTKEKRVDFINGVPYRISSNKSKILPLDFESAKVGIDLTDMEPHSKYSLDQNKMRDLQGEKKYYSNGQLERVISENGKVYIFNLNGEIDTVKYGNKTIEFDYNSSDNKFLRTHIIEAMPDGAEKTTTYYSDGEINVTYKKNDVKRQVDYYDNGIIRSYQKTIGDTDVICRYFDRNGNLTDYWDR